MPIFAQSYTFSKNRNGSEYKILHKKTTHSRAACAARECDYLIEGWALLQDLHTIDDVHALLSLLQLTTREVVDL